MTDNGLFGDGARGATRQELQQAQKRYRLLMHKAAPAPRAGGEQVAAHFGNAAEIGSQAPIAMSHVVELQIDRCDDVRPLAQLAELPALTSLRLGGLGFIADLEWLPPMPNLRALRLEGFGQGLTSLRGIAAAPRLEALVLDPLDHRAIVQSLEPLAALSELRLLALPAISTTEPTLRPLAGLQKLELFHGSVYYGPDEYLMLASALPGLRCPWFNDLAWQLL